jgi:hypothetical protein
MSDTTSTRKWLANGCEDLCGVVCQTRTEAFIPLDNFKETIEAINVLYEDNRKESNHVLFTYRELGDGKIIVHGSTYLLGAYDWEMAEGEEDKIKNLLEEDQTPDILHSLVLDITQNNHKGAVGDFIALIVAPKQSVLVQITDTEYGNSEYTIEK